MDNDALNAALTALVANQQQQQNVLQALANQINNGPAPAPVPFGPAPLAPAKLDLSVRYSGSANESISDWLQLINQKAVAENWGDAEKRRAAVASLCGQALTWQDEIGNRIVDWDDWSQGLRDAFEIQLTESQWQVIIETRRQLPAEPGSTYVLDKIKICRRRPIQMTEIQMIPFLIRGLNNPAHQSVMMGNPPVTIANFLTELRRLEAISDVPVALPAPPVTLPSPLSFPPSASSPMDSVLKALETLTHQMSLLTRSVNQPSVPPPVQMSPPQLPAQPFGTFRRPPGARGEDQCFNCRGYGHFSRNCPHPNPRYPKPSENFQAGPLGQDRR